MKRLKLFILLFGLALAIPVTYFVYYSYSGLKNEEKAELRYFSETLLDQIEDELLDIVSTEEARAIDEYSISFQQNKKGQVVGVKNKTKVTSDTDVPSQSYILGYFQNSPDGSFQYPLQISGINKSDPKQQSLADLKRLNDIFNTKRSSVSSLESIQKPSPVAKLKAEKKEYGIGTRYLRTDRLNKQKLILGQEKKRVEEITITQARNIEQKPIISRESAVTAGKDKWDVAAKIKSASLYSNQDDNKDIVSDATENKVDSEIIFSQSQNLNDQDSSSIPEEIRQRANRKVITKKHLQLDVISSTFQVEVDPLQSVQLDEQHVFLFRRIVLNDKIYRQGLVFKTDTFIEYLGRKYFSEQPLSAFTQLQFSVFGSVLDKPELSFGAELKETRFVVNRVFPRPFSFIEAKLSYDKIPGSKARNTLLIMMSVLLIVIFLGLFSIYQCAGVQVDLSRRRSGFVSSVTHELKTPLTNIRMYIEMLEQGIARDKEREKEYFRILGSESSRLTRLINNVLEFSKLENNQRKVTVTKGILTEVINEVQDVMRVKLQQEGFVLRINQEIISPFEYDREAMVQILINLLDNSIKFGRESWQKKIDLWICQDTDLVKISVRDTGCGIPENVIDKVFDDFFRVDNSLTRKTSGTGIGLALVKKFCQSMGGSVKIVNNDGTGCTVMVSLPVK